MKPTPEQVVAEVIEALPTKFEWYYASYDDELTDRQLGRIINEATDYTGYDAVRDDLDEILTEYRWQSEKDAIDEAFKDADHVEHRDLISGEQEDEIREALWERDNSDPMEELLKRTPEKFFRYRVDCEVGAEYLMDEEEWDETVREIATAVGIDLDTAHPPNLHRRDASGQPVIETNRGTITEMLANSGSGGGLYVFWRGDTEQMVRAMCDFDPKPRTITWENPSLLVLSTMNGSGFECDVVGTITLPFDTENLYLDATNVGPGYSWNDTTGALSGSGYDNRPTITEAQ